MASVAKQVGDHQDYSLRAVGTSVDEVGILRDNFNSMLETLEAQDQELRRSNEELDQFAYIASHDLKSPLRAIDHLATWIEEDLEGVLEGKPRKNMCLLKSRVSRMEGLLDSLLAYSRIGRTQSRIREVSINRLLDEITGVLDIPEGFDIRLPTEDLVLNAMQEPLRLVLQNLIQNAIKHHDRESGVIQVEAHPVQGGVEFLIRDDGPGIERRFHKQVFAMFKTLRPRDEVEGSGMGLALVKKTIENMGGRIEVISNDGERGTEFRVFWPSLISDE